MAVRGMLMKKNTKKGFMTIEAAIMLPILIIAVLSTACLIKVTAADEEVLHAMTDELRLSQTTAYNMKSDISLIPRTVSRVLKSDSDIKAFYPTGFRYLYTDEERGIDDLIRLEGTYRLSVPFGELLKNEAVRVQKATVRAFTGKDMSDDTSFAGFEKEEKADLVWVFPRAGERYHKENCSYIAVKARETVLSSKLKRERSPCKLCKPEERAGSIVYCFKTGEVYHTALCTSVDRYVISMEREDAIENGYTPCMKCGG